EDEVTRPLYDQEARDAATAYEATTLRLRTLELSTNNLNKEMHEVELMKLDRDQRYAVIEANIRTLELEKNEALTAFEFARGREIDVRELQQFLHDLRGRESVLIVRYYRDIVNAPVRDQNFWTSYREFIAEVGQLKNDYARAEQVIDLFERQMREKGK